MSFVFNIVKSNINKYIFMNSRCIITDPKLGRWRINDNIKRKIDLANIDNCGDKLCGIPISKELKILINENDKNWYKNLIKIKGV